MVKPVQNYETVMVISLKLGEENLAALVERFKKFISDNGTIDTVNEWGKRKLAYPINDEVDGHYVFITFSADTSFIEELYRVYNITDGILRSLVVKL